MVLALFALLLLIAARLDQANDSVIRGPFHTIDGDTLASGEERLRLLDIDAPELDQTCEAADGAAWQCGREARRLLVRLVAAGETECAGRERDRYRRLLVRCHAGGTNINAALVRQGMAVDGGAYGSEQAAARREGQGLWAGHFDMPRDWRASRGMMDDPGAMTRLWDWLKGVVGWS